MRNNLSINPQNISSSTFYKKNFYPRTSSSQSLNIPNNIYQSKEIYALKPQKYRINIETIPKEIYNNMLIDVNNVFPAMPKKIDLNNYGNKLRYYVIQSIINLIEKYKLNRKILFFSIYLMDKLLAKKLQFDIETIGLGVFIISCKFLEIDGQIPNVKIFLDYYNYINIRNNNTHNSINFKKITLKEINYVEIKCLKKLDYNLRVPQPINFINILLINGIVFTTDKNDNKNNKINGHIYNLPLQIYEQIIILNADYIQFHPFHLACGCVACAREIYGLEKWNDIFKNLYNITFSKFEEVYQFIKDQNEEYKKYYEHNKEIINKNNSTKLVNNNNNNSNNKNKELNNNNSNNNSNMNSNNKANNNNNNKIINELFINNKLKYKINTNNINNLNESASTKNMNTISINYKEKYLSNNNNNINATINYNSNNTINNNNKISYNNNNKTIAHNNSNNNYNSNNTTTTHNRIISILNDKNKIFKPKNLNLDFKSLETFISNKKHQNSCIDIRDNDNNNINFNDSLISTTDSSRIKNNNNNNNNVLSNIIHNSQSFSGYNKIKYLNSYSKINPYKRNNNNLENKIKNNNNKEKENSNNKLIDLNLKDTSSNLNVNKNYTKIEYEKIKKNLLKNKIDSRYNTINTNNNNISNTSFNYLNNYSMYSNHNNLRKKVKEDYNSNNTINNTFTNVNKRSSTIINNNVNKNNNNNSNNNILKKSSSIIKEIHNMNIKNKLNNNHNFTLNGIKGINTQSKITYLLKMKK